MQRRNLLPLLVQWAVLCCLLATTTTTLITPTAAAAAAAEQNSNATTASSYCPQVSPGTDRALRLVVSNTNTNNSTNSSSNNTIRLPNGKQLLPGQLLSYNGTYIGPLIQIPLGAQVSVDVTNRADIGTSVHWHGMDLQDAAWADGVDGVTQSPIPPGATFRYKFKAEPAGTLWYHSHVGMQFADGLRGPLIVTDPKDPFKGLYDEEVLLLLTDQNNESGEEELRALQEGTASMQMGTCSNVMSQDFSDAPFTTILTNGKGFMEDPTTRQPVGSPFVIKVQRGKRYRVRAIQGAASWGLKVKAPRGHSITLIALDGANVVPTPAKGFVFTPGERVDFILHANQSVGHYWMDVATLTGNNSPILVSYVGAGDVRTAPTPRLSLGCDWALSEPGVIDFKNHTLEPHATVPPPPPGKPDVTLAVYLTNNADPGQSIAAVLLGANNNKTLNATGMRERIPGMSRNDGANVTPQDGCAALPDGRKSAYCWTLNWVEFSGASNGVPLLFPDAQPGNRTYIQEVPFGAVVDVVFINPGAMVHPMHLHGQRFWVLGAGNSADILTPQGEVNYSKLGINMSSNTTSSQRGTRAIMRDTQPVANAIPVAPTAAAASTAGSGRNTPTTTTSPNSSSTSPKAPKAPMPPGSMTAGAMPGRRHRRRHLLQQPSPPMGPMPPPAAAAAMPANQKQTASLKTPSPQAATETGDGMRGMDQQPMQPPAATTSASGSTSAAPPSGSMGVTSGASMTTAGRQDHNSMGGNGVGNMAASATTTTTTRGGSDSRSMGGGGGGAAGGMAMAPGGDSSDGAPATAASVPLVPGYAVIRFKANNPGMWALHCHIDLHANSGMMMVFKVGRPEGAPTPTAAAAAGDDREQPSWSLPKDITGCGATEEQQQNNMSDTMSGEGGGKTASKAAARATSSASARGAPAVTVHAMLVLQLAATIILMA